jgi:hypothetical protein
MINLAGKDKSLGTSNKSTLFHYSRKFLDEARNTYILEDSDPWRYGEQSVAWSWFCFAQDDSSPLSAPFTRSVSV